MGTEQIPSWENNLGQWHCFDTLWVPYKMIPSGLEYQMFVKSSTLVGSQSLELGG